MRLPQHFAQLCFAAGIGGFGENHQHAAAPGFFRGRLQAAGEHFHAHGHGIVELGAECPLSQLGDGVLDQVGVGREILQLVDRVVEAHNGGFAGWPHDGLREENAGLACLGQKRLDARAGLNQNHHGDGIAAEIEMGDLLSYAVVRNLKIKGLQIVNHFTAAIAHSHRHTDQCYLDFDLGLSVLGRQLDFDPGFGTEWAGRGLGTCGNAGERQPEKQSNPYRRNPGHLDHLTVRTIVSLLPRECT